MAASQNENRFGGAKSCRSHRPRGPWVGPAHFLPDWRVMVKRVPRPFCDKPKGATLKTASLQNVDFLDKQN